jgi:transcriptional regulator PpsR
MLDMDAVIRDVSLSNEITGEAINLWFGRPWIETVADSGIDKVRRSLEDARSSGVSAFRQINQIFPSGLQLPIEYTTVRLGGGAGLVAVGKSLQASSELQSRLIAAQQAMERDYWKLREVETRYRLLFDASNEAVLVLSAGDLRVVEANPAAIRALGLTRGWDFLGELAVPERDTFQAMLTRVRESGRAPGSVFHLGPDRSQWILRASLMTADPAALYMLQLVPVVGSAALAAPRTEPIALAPILQRIPDGFVVIDRDGVVRQANQAFLDLVQAGAEGAVIGQRIDRWLRRPGADLSAMLATLRRHGMVCLFSTTLQGELGSQVEVEVSGAGASGADSTLIGVVLRDVGRRLSVPGESRRESLVPTLEPLSGRTSLRDLVQEAVGLVERHYVESALQLAEGNRTAAAELLGLSRQSLYAKLNRYGFESGSDVASLRDD